MIQPIRPTYGRETNPSVLREVNLVSTLLPLTNSHNSSARKEGRREGGMDGRRQGGKEERREGEKMIRREGEKERRREGVSWC